MNLTNNGNHFSCCKIRENESGKLFCFPHAGAGATVFASWGRYTPDNVSLYPVLYPAREQRRNEPLPNGLRELARSIAAENSEVFTKNPFVLYGHCEGGIIAYETAVALKELYGVSPELLVVSGANPPDVHTAELIKEGISIEEAAEIFAERGFLDKRFAKNKMYTDCFVPVLMNDFLLLQRYCDTEHKSLDCPILLMYGSEDPNIDKEKLCGWNAYTSSEFDKKEFEGGHFFITTQNIGFVVRSICDCFFDNK